MSIKHMRVYYNFCPPITTQLAQFDRKISGPTAVSLEAAEGRCVPNSVQVSIDFNFGSNLNSSI